MIDYGERPSNQSMLPITDDAEFVKEVRQWVRDNPDAWDYYLMTARLECSFGKVSPNYLMQILRHRKKVSIRNGAAPILARMALEQDETLRFRLARSRYDGYFEVAL